MSRNIRDYLGITLKGMAMGAADVVPGVSGGTIALITGIYKELISTISSFNLKVIKTIRTKGIVAAFKSVNGAFLSFLFLGIIISVLSLAKVFHYLLDNEPVLVWSFFFGLIIASVWLIGKMVKSWDVKRVSILIIGAIISFGITVISPAHGPDTLWFLFIAGMLAFIAMILPGISGSFILLLLGAYQLVLGKVNGMLDAISYGDSALLTSSVIALVVFVLGGITGLFSFSRVLKWMFEKYESLTLALLTGFLIGSLNKVWPWKQTTEVWFKHAGSADEKAFPLIQKNVLPSDYSFITNADQQLGLVSKDPQLIAAIGLALAGFFVIFLLEKISVKFQK